MSPDFAAVVKPHYPGSQIPQNVTLRPLGLGESMTVNAGGIAERDMCFCGEPTMDFDTSGMYLQYWYDHNHPDYDPTPFWVRLFQIIWFGWGPPRSVLMEGFMLGLINEVGRINNERKRQVALLPPRDDQ